jgi:peptidoglycan/xylan/chitin deacetylase (PgdA/CDA1 family)
MNVVGTALPARVAWAKDLPLRLPPDILALVEKAATIDLGAIRQSAINLRLAAAFTDAQPTSSRLPFSYQRVPGILRRLAASAIGRLQRARQSSWASFPGWPLDLSADVAADLADLPTVTFARTPALLTHDIDSAEGLRNLNEKFLPIEEAAGMRSANYIVPCAWPIDSGLIRSILERGHEIGVHGYDHANRTPFATEAERKVRVDAGHRFGRQYGAVGYRAPSLLRTKALIDALEPLYRYDSSIPTSGGPFPVPNNGCASARPWRFGRMWELPLSLPRDGSLRFLGHSPTEIGDLWREIAIRIADSGGMVNLLTHCEAGFSGNGPMLREYRRFVEWLAADSRFECVLPAILVERLDREWPLGSQPPASASISN